MPDAPTYRASLRVTLRNTAAAYGYALSISPTALIINNVHGKPTTGQIFLFVIGAIVGFALLDALAVAGRDGGDSPDDAFPGAGAMNIFSVTAALGVATVAAHIGGGIAWLVAPFGATVTYLVVVGLQVRLTAAARQSRR